MEFLDGPSDPLQERPDCHREPRLSGAVATEDGVIADVHEGAVSRSGVDFDGDYLLPGLVELHTDHLEAHYVPRPAVMWHAGSAVLAYDAQIAAAGITTVFDSFRVGTDEADPGSGLGEKVVPLVEAMQKAAAAGLLRSDHLTHLRCEVPGSQRRRLTRPRLSWRRTPRS